MEVFLMGHSRWRGREQGSHRNPAILGSYRVERDVLRFQPRFPLEPGLRYRAVFDPAKLLNVIGTRDSSVSTTFKAEPLTADYALPSEPPRPSTTTVTHVYPSASVLPENQLKFYIHFSAPMSRGEAYEHIRLLDAAGKPLDLVFLELGVELWEPSGKRFTLFYSPGRIKKGLKPREELGPIL